MAHKNNKSPLIVIGIDAGGPDFIKDWAEQGYLPTLSSVMDGGLWARTCGPELVSEHGVWISLFSGISRGEHGYHYFRQLKPGTYDLETVIGLDIDAPPFWSYLQGTDKKSLIIDAADTHLYPGLPGVQLSNWATHHNLDPDHYVVKSEPPEVYEDIREKFGSKQLTVENHNSTYEQDKEIHRTTLSHVKKKGELCSYLISRNNPDLIVIVFAESHSGSHQFWKYHPDNAGQGAPECELTNAIRDIYSAIDRETQSILDMFDNPNVCILSSVGLEDEYPNSGLCDEFCKALGYQASSEADGRMSFRPMDIARKFIPESIRVALTKNLSRERRERLLSDKFTNGTDWSKTVAFSLPVSYTSMIRVNLKGREPEGIVNPGEEYKTLVDKIVRDLKQLIDPVSGKPAVTKIDKTYEIFGPDTHPALPDVFIEWKPGSFMERVVHPQAEITQKRPEFFRRSDHSTHGFISLKGPSIKGLGNIADVQVLDVAPTLLNLLDEPIPPRMKGELLHLL